MCTVPVPNPSRRSTAIDLPGGVCYGHVHESTLKIKVWDKLRALESLAKYFNLLKEQVHLTAGDELIERLNRARKRLQPK